MDAKSLNELFTRRPPLKPRHTCARLPRDAGSVTQSAPRGEITAENYVYAPRGPMPPHSKAKQDFSRWERQIVNARFARLALEERPTRIWLNWRTPHGRE
jgi:hypothetical protein